MITKPIAGALPRVALEIHASTEISREDIAQ
jgi:hypothetical protein